MPIFTGKSGDGSDAQELKPHQPYTSRTKANMCKNKECVGTKRHSSAYCKECSDKHKKK